MTRRDQETGMPQAGSTESIGDRRGAGDGREGLRAPEQGQGGDPQRGQYGYGYGGGAHENWGAFDGDQGPQDPGYGQATSPQHHFDADYIEWRAEQLRRLDEDYAHWRRERYGKFSEEFTQWREGRRQSRAQDAADQGKVSGPVAGHADGVRSDDSALHGKIK